MIGRIFYFKLAVIHFSKLKKSVLIPGYHIIIVLARAICLFIKPKFDYRALAVIMK